MVLITGGTDGGNISDVSGHSRGYCRWHLLNPRFGKQFKPRIISLQETCRGQAFIGKDISRIKAGSSFTLFTLDKIGGACTLRMKFLNLARKAIHDLFLEHVMMHAPGYPTQCPGLTAEVSPLRAAGEMDLCTSAKSKKVTL